MKSRLLRCLCFVLPRLGKAARSQAIAQVKCGARAVLQVTAEMAGSQKFTKEVCQFLLALLDDRHMPEGEVLKVSGDLLTKREVTFGGQKIALALLEAGMAPSEDEVLGLD